MSDSKYELVDLATGKKSVLLLVNRDGDLQYLGLRLN